MREDFSLLRDGFSFIRESTSLFREGFSLLRDCLSFIRESTSLFREGFSLLRDGFSLLRDCFSFIRESTSLFPEGFSLLREGFSLLRFFLVYSRKHLVISRRFLVIIAPAILDLPCPSGILWFCHSVIVIIQMKLEYHWGQLAIVDQILYDASLRWAKGCIRFWDRLNQNSGFRGNRKHPLTYNGENDVATFSHLFLSRFFLYLQVTRTCIRSWMSTNFGQIGTLTTELAALERLKIF